MRKLEKEVKELGFKVYIVNSLSDHKKLIFFAKDLEDLNSELLNYHTEFYSKTCSKEKQKQQFDEIKSQYSEPSVPTPEDYENAQFVEMIKIKIDNVKLELQFFGNTGTLKEINNELCTALRQKG